jgi:hypothetical protein
VGVRRSVKRAVKLSALTFICMSIVIYPASPSLGCKYLAI